MLYNLSFTHVRFMQYYNRDTHSLSNSMINQNQDAS